eukprot:m51a1_g1093 putative gamma-tubulin complex component 2 isoform x1 (765) ;mRNA; r:66278-69215
MKPAHPRNPSSLLAAALDEALSRPPIAVDELPPHLRPGAAQSATSSRATSLMPRVPAWSSSRPFLSGDFVAHEAAARAAELCGGAPGVAVAGDVSVKGLAAAVQERLLIEDLLFVLAGVEGSLIRASPSPTEFIVFTVDDAVDVSLRGVAQRVLPAAVYYTKVSQHAVASSKYDAGFVANAFAAALFDLLKEYLIFVAQLEHQHKLGLLTLQKILYYIQEPMHTLFILAQLVDDAAVSGVKGGALLDLIQQKSSAMSGDSRARELLAYVLDRASVPFMSLMSQWIWAGTLAGDVHGEFFVEEREGLRAEDDYLNTYWSQRHSVRASMVPAFLSKLQDRALAAGKHLAVVRECSGEDVGSAPDAGDALRVGSERECAEAVERACAAASARLLGLMFDKLQLRARLRSLKHFFLLDQGDFFVHFMDVAGSELRRAAADINVPRLNALLELALRTSPLDADPYKGALECDLLPCTLVTQLLSIIHVNGDVVEVRAQQQLPPGILPAGVRQSKMTGMEAMAFDYKVDFPLSLVISRVAIVKYQMILRFLLLLKHVERRLSATWVALSGTRSLAGIVQPLHMLRQRMCHFLQNYLYFFAYEVVEPSWAALEERLASAASLDDVLNAHADLLDACLIRGTLTDPRVVRAVTKITSACLLFANFTESFNAAISRAIASVTQVEGLDMREAMLAAARNQAKDPDFVAALSRLDRAFTSALCSLLATLRSYTAADAQRVASLLTALDFNGFYSSVAAAPVSASVMLSESTAQQ